MRVLKTMNTLGEIKKEDFAGLSLADSTTNYRRVGKTVEKVHRFAADYSPNERVFLPYLSYPLRFFGFIRF